MKNQGVITLFENRQFHRLFKERVKKFNIANVYEERANKKIKRVDNEISIK
jgi:ribosomal protein S4E